jgi:Ran GTPase-activating protein (RanGAP) involved in mRNA processing and transport
MSTERARQQTVSEVALEDISEEKAIQLLKLAHNGVYETADMPECWRGVFEEMEQKLSR